MKEGKLDHSSKRGARKGSPASHIGIVGVWTSQEKKNSGEGPFKGETVTKVGWKLLGDK